MHLGPPGSPHRWRAVVTLGLNVIDIQSIQGGGEGAWQAQLAEVKAVWRDAGLFVLDGSEPLPDVVQGVPAAAIWGRRGGGSGGVTDEAIKVFLNLWPLAVAGYVGAVSADAWALTKKGVAVALKALLGDRASEVTIKVADEGNGLADDMYKFKSTDLRDVDRALDSMVDNVVVRATFEERTWTQYMWDGRLGLWVPRP